MADVIAQVTPVYQKPEHPKAPITFRHHILPPILGFGMFIAVLGLLNSQWLMAQAQYRMLKPQSQSLYASSTYKPAADSVKVTIPSINVDAPVVYDETSTNEAKVQLALRRGVVHYGNSALPGQVGNIVILGHSSGQAWAPGDYKFVFTLLDKMAVGDRIMLDYKGTRYIYRVAETKVVAPTDISVTHPTTDSQLTLITCTPVGTSKNRRVVVAKQLSPNPSKNTPVAPENLQRISVPTLPR